MAKTILTVGNGADLGGGIGVLASIKARGSFGIEDQPVTVTHGVRFRTLYGGLSQAGVIMVHIETPWITEIEDERAACQPSDEGGA